MRAGRGGTLDRLLELDRERPVPAGRRIAEHPGRQRTRAVAQLDSVDAGAGRGAGGPRAPPPGACAAPRSGPTVTRPLLASLSSTYSGPPRSMPTPRRWPTVKRCWPRWLAEHGSVQVDDRPGPVAQAAVAAQEARPVGPGQEAQVLGIGLARHRQPGSGGDPPDLGLGQLAQREAHPRQRRRRQRSQHVGLVLGRIGGGAQQRAVVILALGDPGVVTGRERSQPSRSASSSIASRRTWPLHPTQGFGVSPPP